MNRRILLSWMLFCAVFLAAGSLVAQTCPIPPGATQFPQAPPTLAYTHTAVASGNWHIASKWNPPTVPGAGAIVCIPAGMSITYRTNEANPANIVRFIRADGEFRFGIQAPYKLYVDTIYVSSTGAFLIGAPGFPVQPGQKSEIVFKPWNGALPDLNWDPKRESLGLVAAGAVKIYGEDKSHMVPMSRDALKTSGSLVLDSIPSNWRQDDKLVLTGS